MAQASPPPQSQRIGGAPVVFEGEYRGKSRVRKADGSDVVTRAGELLESVQLLVKDGERERLISVTLRAAAIPPSIPLGEFVRIPGSFSVTRRGDRVYVSQWGNSIDAAVVSDAASEVAYPELPLNGVLVQQ